MSAEKIAQELNSQPVERRISGHSHEKYTQPSEIGFSPNWVEEGIENQVMKDKVLLLVGGGGIGSEAARLAVQMGADIMISSRSEKDGGNEERARSFAAKLSEMGNGRVLWTPGNIIRPYERKSVLDTTIAEFGKIDSLIITSAAIDNALLLRTKKPTERRDFEVNYWGPRYTIQEVSEQMRKQSPRGGDILVFSSLAAVVAPAQYEYGPAKAALDNFIQSVAQERMLSDIRFNAVSPELVNTPMISKLTEEQQNALHALSGAARNLEPDEPASLGLYILTRQAPVNGQLVSVIGV